MSISALSAAHFVAEQSNWKRSHLTIQKLLYIAHMFHLGQHSSPLVTGNFEAWDYGPVHPEVYRRLRVFGADWVTNIFFEPPPSAGTERDKIAEIVGGLASKNAADLVGITHWKHGAWAKYYRPGERGIIIPNHDIRKEYKLRIVRHRKRRAEQAEARP